ncbi:MAG TPA: ACT domain-containing protein [Candidatus Dormibacteraeota bacterium]|nr:ACT domain-containing protein [Candidatus Dormibacteraeota bacterium]
MPRAKQLTISVPDRPGMLGDVATALGEKKVNIVGFCGAKQGDRGMIWLVVDKPAAAKKVFASKGWDATEDEVLAVTLSDSPGSLGRFASKLGRAGVNITFAYTGSAGSARKLNAYFGVSDLKAALKVRA